MSTAAKSATKDALPTIADIRAAIPAHCFERSTLRSLSFVLRDLLIVAAILSLGLLLPTTLSQSPLLLPLAWTLYAFLQGTALTGLWVLAHECGHGAFSDNTLVNDVFGLVMHSVLFVPYYSWQYSHARHHARTNHLVEGETHTPGTRKGFMATYKLVFDALGDDCFALLQIIVHLAFGWPMYLLLNATGGRRTHDGRRVDDKDVGVMDHFRPWSNLFPANWRLRVAVSSLALVAWALTLFALGASFGHLRVFLLYFGPYLVTNGWLVLYTWLQHTDHGVAHFGDDEWTWLKGAALGTVDRPYGVFDWMHHHIGSSHVAHHLFSNMPHYHAVEATQHVKRVLGAKYNYCGDALPVALWRVAKTCHFVDSVQGAQTYTWLGADRTGSTVKSKGA